MKSLTEVELFAIFPQARRIIPAKIRELRTDRAAIIAEVEASLNLGRGCDKVTQAIWTEWIRLSYGPGLTSIDRDLARLWPFKNLVTGKKESVDRITNEMIARAKSIPIENLITEEMKHSGRLLRGLCPFHEEKTPSFYVYPDSNSCWCFGCSSGGDTIQFCRLKYGHTFEQAVRFLDGRP